jgi:hypothetical protein
MKRWFLLLLMVSAWGIARADTAYTALHLSKPKIDGEAKLVEVKGDGGQPQPGKWTVLIADPAARGGVREIIVSKGAIVSERTPLHGVSEISVLPPINLALLNVDSDGVFDAANREAVREKVGFDSVDYELKANNTTGSPYWAVTLYDNKGDRVGIMQVSAQNGALILPLQLDPDAHPQKSTHNGGSHHTGGFIGKMDNMATTTAKKISDGTLRAVGDVQEFLTGDRTIGPKDKNEKEDGGD